jgi:hypothetical protein
MTEQFTCARCKRTFDKTRSDAEADQERLELWGNVPMEECDVICEECFQDVVAWMADRPNDPLPN